MFRSAAIIASLGLLAASARASDLDVSWQTPEQGCPDREHLREGLARRLQRDVRFGPDAELHVTGVITQQDAGYQLLLTTGSAQGTEQRTLRAEGCNELAHASVLIVALLFAPAQAAGMTTTSPGERPSGYVRAQLVGDLGTLPAPSLGPSVVLGLSLGDWLLEAGGTYLFAQSVSAPGQPRVAALQLTTAAAGACFRVVRRPLLAPCLHAELGRLSASGRNLREAYDSGLTWLMGGAGVRLGVDLTRWLHWHSELAAGVPWDRAEFSIYELGTIYRIPGLIGRVTTGLEGSF